MSDKLRCEGYRRYGGALTMGRPVWEQCKNDATVMLKIEQDGRIQDMPGCNECWKEAKENRIPIIEANPL